MAWAAYSVITPRISRGHDGLTLFITGTAIALWAVHAMAGSVPDRLPGVTAYVVLVAATVAIGAGYGCWNIGILRGNLIVLASASYVTPVFSSIIAALTLGAALTGTFWRGVLDGDNRFTPQLVGDSECMSGYLMPGKHGNIVPGYQNDVSS